MGPSPDAILQLGSAFWASKTLLSAVELGVFTALGDGPLERSVLADRCGLHPRSAEDFLDALVALGMLARDGARYANTPETDLFLDRKKPAYVGGLLEMFNARLYGFWGSLTDALTSGRPQNEARQGESFFGTLYSDPRRLDGFLAAMSGVSMGAARAIATMFPWRDYKSFVDVGCAQGALAVQVALAHSHLQGLGFDLPPVQASFNDYVQRHGLKERVTFRGGDFFRDPLPRTDVIVMGHVLHDWSLDEKKQLIAKAYDALPEGGALLVYEAMIDDERRSNAFGLLMSLNMLIETPAGFDFTGAQCCTWMKAAGFRETRVEHLIGPDSMVIGLK
ncbi:methyltransferase [Rhodoferax sp.]|uniref:methyltransferase n=1 Tax=Rhodoferax sp. TaxID=50421 RepID=UPI002723CABB|nr:methyltransferase [Rhodoferax sp.]MDO9197391.1 methyltransferase [Rhodoferax sp.]